jgi:hypothetical protein
MKVTFDSKPERVTPLSRAQYIQKHVTQIELQQNEKTKKWEVIYYFNPEANLSSLHFDALKYFTICYVNSLEKSASASTLFDSEDGKE